MRASTPHTAREPEPPTRNPTPDPPRSRATICCLQGNPLSSMGFRRAGDRGRTGDVQLGKVVHVSRDHLTYNGDCAHIAISYGLAPEPRTRDNATARPERFEILILGSGNGPQVAADSEKRRKSSRYGATGGVVDALRTRSGLIPP